MLNPFKFLIICIYIFIYKIIKIDKEKYSIESVLNHENRSNILIFSHLNRERNEEIQKSLEEKKIFIALREGFLRLSPHIFNNESDMENLIEELNLL